MIDCHAHLDAEQFIPDRESVIKHSLAELQAIINIGTSVVSSRSGLKLAASSNTIFSTVGIHPEEIVDPDFNLEQNLNDISQFIKSHQEHRLVGVGEIGLDFHFENSSNDINKNRQEQLFDRQLDLAIENGLPVVIHSRDAFVETCQRIKSKRSRLSRVVWHSFTGGIQELQTVLALDLMVGINGIVTFPSAKSLREAVTEVPLSRVLLETDAPYLAPQACRGQRNEPWMVKYVAEAIAQLKSVSIAEVINQTDQNAKSFFDLDLSQSLRGDY